MSTTEIMRVRYTPDGDTVRCLRSLTENGIQRTEEIRVRLAYLDAPELGNPQTHAYAVSARAYLRRLLNLHEPVRVTLYGQDGYGRLIGEIRRVRDEGNCGLRLVAGGYAALYHCPQSRGEYYAAQENAQRKRLGIWKVPGPWQSPWLYRRNATLMASTPP
jgi:endonuclease YncB( thermonuclease family)